MKTNLAPKAALCALLILFTFDLNAQQGSISPEVKKIDCDKMYPF